MSFESEVISIIEDLIKEIALHHAFKANVADRIRQLRDLIDAVTGYAIDCPKCNTVHLSKEEYFRQVSQPDDRWECPKCGAISDFNDEIYESKFGGL